MNKPIQPQQMQVNVDLSRKEPFKCDNVLPGGEICGHQFFVQYFQLFYVSQLETGAPQPITVPQPVWVCASCKRGYFGAKPNKK
jgi:hypothetical protein